LTESNYAKRSLKLNRDLDRASKQMSKEPTYSLLSEITLAFLALNTLENPDYVNSEGQNYHFVGAFPELLREHIGDPSREPTPLLGDAICQILGQQNVEPCWCFTRVLHGYILIMHSNQRSTTLLQWVEPGIGKHYAEEARQQGRFVDSSQRSIKSRGK
jgi:hypothetical protein